MTDLFFPFLGGPVCWCANVSSLEEFKHIFGPFAIANRYGKVLIYNRRSDSLCVAFLVWRGPLGFVPLTLRYVRAIFNLLRLSLIFRVFFFQISSEMPFKIRVKWQSLGLLFDLRVILTSQGYLPKITFTDSLGKGPLVPFFFFLRENLKGNN